MTTGRLEAFSDGVFAIAATLLVLDLRVPHPEGDGLLGALLGQPGRKPLRNAFLKDDKSNVNITNSRDMEWTPSIKAWLDVLWVIGKYGQQSGHRGIEIVRPLASPSF